MTENIIYILFGLWVIYCIASEWRKPAPKHQYPAFWTYDDIALAEERHRADMWKFCAAILAFFLLIRLARRSRPRLPQTPLLTPTIYPHPALQSLP